MSSRATLADFYREKLDWLPEGLQQDLGHFNVFRLEDHVGPDAKPIAYSRRDFFKISLVRGECLFHFAERSITTTQPTLLFFNPQVPYTWEPNGEALSGYFCIFTRAFLASHLRAPLEELTPFRPGSRPDYFLDAGAESSVGQVFERMLLEIDSAYPLKYDLLRAHLLTLVHTALKFSPARGVRGHSNAAARLTAAFSELLERQFPIESRAQRFTLRSPGQVAQRLSVHVNHLNRSVRETTGKTTTEHLADRVVHEALALLKHTDWNVAEVGYSLGFDEPAHFSTFFKRRTGQTPTGVRSV